MAAAMIYLPPMQRAGRNLLLTVAAFGVATIIFGISKNFWLSFAMLFLTGAFDNVSMIIRQTLQQLLTPDNMRGRVSAVSSVFVGASDQLGGFESGAVAQAFGPVVSVVSGGIGTLIVVGVTALIEPGCVRSGPCTKLALRKNQRQIYRWLPRRNLPSPRRTSKSRRKYTDTLDQRYRRHIFAVVLTPHCTKARVKQRPYGTAIT